ncbi:hypothetical protein [Cerasicoccus frondis]|uniref:hypothetical protein n=1 Tax=Cerasicoccus frondis TaxID=490090 RepID=UPI002852B226|nr:hypothetical protein [Cerasicoccus frondis]
MKMKAIDILSNIAHLPMIERNGKVLKASKKEVRRWLDQKAVVMNGERPAPNDEFETPLTELVFFPNSPSKRTTFR